MKNSSHHNSSEDANSLSGLRSEAWTHCEDSSKNWYDLSPIEKEELIQDRIRELAELTPAQELMLEGDMVLRQEERMLENWALCVKYKDWRAPEIYDLISEIPGISPGDGDVGHKTEPFEMWLDVEDISGLELLARAVYNNEHGWHIALVGAPPWDGGLILRGPAGRIGYKEVCDNIREEMKYALEEDDDS